MIPAHKHGAFARLIRRYVGRKVRASFRGVWRRGALPAPTTPLVVYANHTSWWDGFVLHELLLGSGWDGYCVMEEAQLARYRFLARVGAFSIRRHDAGSALASLRYAADLLRRPGVAVVIFPEGVLRPADGSPIALERGVEVLGRLSGAPCVPVALRYAFLEHERPDVLVAIGEPHPATALAGFATRLDTLTRSLAAIGSLTGLVPVVRGRRSVAERWDAVRGLGLTD